MKKSYAISLLGLASMTLVVNAYADVSFHGYGQVVMGTTFSNNRTFPTESQGYNYRADPTFTPNSNFALQASAPLSNNITATTQILARGDDDFQPKFQWAYLKYDFNDTFALKAGRLQLPNYQYSDYLFVGEAYPWVVPPESVYFSQITAYDGLNLSLSESIGDWYLYAQAIYGSFGGTVTNPLTTYPGRPVASYSVEENNITGLVFESTYDDWLTLRAGAFYEPISLTLADGPTAQLNTLVNFIASQPGMTDTVKALVNSDDPTLYSTAAIQITRDNWLLIAEYQGLQYLAGASGITLPEFVSEYVSLGYHFGKLLPMLTFGHRNQWVRADKIKSAIPPNATLLPGVPLDSVVGGIAADPNERNKDYFYEASLRYDLTPTVALKLDYTFYQSHYKTSDYPELGVLTALGGPTLQNPQNAQRLLAAVTFSF
jgi:hypothetical protein